MFEGGYALHQVQQGRLFIRGAADGRSIVFGVVETPASAPFEQVFMARLNDSLWLDLQNPRADAGAQVTSRADDLGKIGVATILTALKFRDHLLPDALDVFVRKSHLFHDDPAKRWDIVAGVAPGRLSCAPVEGLYEITPGGVAFTGVSQQQFVGAAILSIIREPMWGPGGRFGLATDLDPEVSERVIREDRERHMRDPRFCAYVEAIKVAGAEMGMAYTAQDLVDREERVKGVVEAILAKERMDGIEGLHRAVTQRP